MRNTRNSCYGWNRRILGKNLNLHNEMKSCEKDSYIKDCINIFFFAIFFFLIKQTNVLINKRKNVLMGTWCIKTYVLWWYYKGRIGAIWEQTFVYYWIKFVIKTVFLKVNMVTVIIRTTTKITLKAVIKQNKTKQKKESI